MTTPRLQSLRHALIPVLASFLALAWISPAQAQVTYSGRAFGASIDGATFADTGELPPSGGTLEASEPAVDVNGLTATGLFASTSGANGVASSLASLNSLVISSGELSLVEALFVVAEATANCDGVVGATDISPELIVQGVPVEVTGQPNQQVPIPGVGLLVVNEQTISSGNGSQVITVNALHLFLEAGGEIVVASARSDVHGCTTVCHDFVTGGGWINVDAKRGNFGFNAGFKPNASSPTASFNYIDHNTGMHVKSTSITVYVQGASPTTRHFEGDATIDGVSGTYSVDVADNDEPGTTDTFAIVLSNGYAAGGTLAGGNIQLHGECAP